MLKQQEAQGFAGKEAHANSGGIIAAMVAFVLTLSGAILGGPAGIRSHRTVGKAGLDL
ncbi:MAG TPA: hypothetical protein VM688_00310 [Nocardioidaceae bacterium]|jgi:hypothetical protein|nr:hypothetical protein [Nocardioidaceae bacterium]